MKKAGILIFGLAMLAGAATNVRGGMELVKDSVPRCEIVVEREALPQVRFAAEELRSHLQKISGANVPIVHEVSGSVPHHIYVGESQSTRQAGVSVGDLPMEGYKIETKGDDVFLLGRDATFPAYPRGFASAGDIPRLTKEWQQYTGEKWDLPRNGLYDPRNFSKELGFSIYDPTGTLFAVYAFLEQLGVRWYMPYGDFGTVIPSLATITIPDLQVSASPVFSRRYMRWSFPSADLPGFLWFKRQKLGMSEMVWFGHGTTDVTRFTGDSHPEYRAMVDGAPARSKRDGGVPRLAPPLRDAMIKYGDKFFDRYPEMKTWPAAPADGLAEIDDRDVAAGWARRDRGDRGIFSDYVWSFVNEVAEAVARSHPDKVIMGLAYSGARLVPDSPAKLGSNVGVVFCQVRSLEMIDPARRSEVLQQRAAWQDKMASKEFYLWEYYLNHEEKFRLAGVPVVFTRIMQEDARSLRGLSKGEYVECSYGPGMMLNPALNHYPYMVQARLYWEPDLDLKAFLKEYCDLFYGPAHEEMEEFFTFAEEVWMRNEPRDISPGNGFLKPADVDRFGDILDRAKRKAGDSIYGKRIAAIAEECAPMKGIFESRREYVKGLEAVEAGDGAAATLHLRRAVDAAYDDTSRAEALFSLGKAYRDILRDNGKAIATWRELWQISYKSLPVAKRGLRVESFLSAVELYRTEKKNEEALRLLEEFDVANSASDLKIRVLHAAGDVAVELGDHKKALEKYQLALAVKGIPQNLSIPIQAKLNKLQAELKM